MIKLFYGAVVTPLSLTEYAALPHALICVSTTTGKIAWIETDVLASSLQETLTKHGLQEEVLQDIVELKAGEFLMPGFIDTHTHAPQVPNIGSGQQYELLDWLANVTFPMEARFSDKDFARKAYESVVRRIIDSGTTTCCYYGTLHKEATNILADIVHHAGQRAFVGKCNMDRESKPYYVEPSPHESLEATQAVIKHIRGLTHHPHTALVQPILTPRFAISCSSDLLSKLGALAQADPGLTIQTHISENLNEVAFVKTLFPPESLPSPPHPPPLSQANQKPKETTYAGVYDAYGLLRENTVLAHAVHLEDSEVELIKWRNAGISHCPTSNFNLRSGCAKVGMLLDKGVKVGLGTDVSGGFSTSILSEIQHASFASKVVAMQAASGASTGTTTTTTTTTTSETSSTTKADTYTTTSITKSVTTTSLSTTTPGAPVPAPPPTTGFANRQLSVPTLLYLATQGGADVCNIPSVTGSLDVGKAFDALVVSVRSEAGNPGIWGADWDVDLGITGSDGKTEKEVLEGLVERFFFCGDDRNIRRVYVQGKFVGGKEYVA